MKKLRKGFTIVELVIVIAVIAILTAILVPTFVHLSKKAKTASDQSLVANLNTALKMEQAETGKSPSTMHEAVESLYNYGFVLENLITKSEDDLVYSLEENKFYLTKDVEEGYKYWHLYDSPSKVPANQTWSIYATAGDWTDFSDVSVGFDVGECYVKEVNYVNSTNSKRDVLIRTDAASTTLKVNGYVDPSDATKGDVVTHYGYAGALNVIKCATGSYHENGKVSFAEISKGRIVLESASEIEHIHINKKDSSSFDTVVVEDKGAEALPQAITRDEVTLESGSVDVVKVVASGTEEVIKVYAAGSTGTTEKTETQNTNVESSLGQLVLDNGSGSKALDADEKFDAKDAVASEAVTEEFESDPLNASYVARIGQTGYLKLNSAIQAATDGKTVVLLQDVEFEGITGNNRLFITKSITLDGNYHTVTAHGRGFGIRTQKVTFKNITIDNSDASARCIDTRGGTDSYPAVEELNLYNVYLSTPGSGTLQPLTIGGNQSYKMKVNIENSLLMTNRNGNTGYTIITYNPVDMTIKNSEIAGWACLYMKGVDSSYGSKGSSVTIKDSKLSSLNKYSGSSDNFGTIVFEDRDITVDIVDSELRASALYVSQKLVVFSAASATNICTGTSVSISGNSTVTYGVLVGFGQTSQGYTGGEDCTFEISGGRFDNNPSNYVAEGKTATQQSDGTWIVQ